MSLSSYPERQHSLARLYEGSRAGVIGFMALSFLSLSLGLSLPAITLTHFHLMDDPYSILTGLADLWQNNSYFLFAVIAIFSVAFPYLKLVLLVFLYFAPVKDPAHPSRLLQGLMVLGKWSMLDVMVVAIMVITLKSGFVVSASVEIGIYFFAASVVLTMLVTSWISRLYKARERDWGEEG